MKYYHYQNFPGFMPFFSFYQVKMQRIDVFILNLQGQNPIHRFDNRLKAPVIKMSFIELR